MSISKIGSGNGGGGGGGAAGLASASVANGMQSPEGSVAKSKSFGYSRSYMNRSMSSATSMNSSFNRGGGFIRLPYRMTPNVA